MNGVGCGRENKEDGWKKVSELDGEVRKGWNRGT